MSDEQVIPQLYTVRIYNTKSTYFEYNYSDVRKAFQRFARLMDYVAFGKNERVEFIYPESKASFVYERQIEHIINVKRNVIDEDQQTTNKSR